MEILVETDVLEEKIYYLKNQMVQDIGVIQNHLNHLYNNSYHRDYQSSIRDKLEDGLRLIEEVESALENEFNYISNTYIEEVNQVVDKYKQIVRNDE